MRRMEKEGEGLRVSFRDLLELGRGGVVFRVLVGVELLGSAYRSVEEEKGGKRARKGGQLELGLLLLPSSCFPAEAAREIERTFIAIFL